MAKKVMAFGAFDGITPGHIYYLKQAKKLGYLIVAIARDKAKWRFQRKYDLPETERKHLVELINIADKVTLGGVSDAFQRIRQIKPDIIAITPFHHVDPDMLQNDLRAQGLKTEVVMIKPYRSHIYTSLFRKTVSLKGGRVMGLPIKKGLRHPEF